jgi:hypothetical protein
MAIENKDWVGNKNSIFKTLGASNHTTSDREENDFYATDPIALEKLLEFETFSKNIWEPACGQGHLTQVLLEHDYNVKSTDLYNRGFGDSGIDFLQQTESWDGDIITNPPYKYAEEFIRKALALIPDGNKVAMFLKIQFLEGKARKKLFAEFPPIRVWVSSSRILCAKNADFEGMKKGGGSAVAYAWYIWEKGFKGETTLKWFN